MRRLLFTKRGEAIWISHLDLMRLFQRAFKRAELTLTHSHGFNPRPSVSIALPLSVGTESICELLDFDLVDCDASCEEIRDRLNHALVSGIQVLEVYEGGRKVRDLSLMRSRIHFFYDNGIPENAQQGIGKLLARDSLIVPKKTKNGMQDQDLIPMIRSAELFPVSERELVLEFLHCCQNPTLNPMQIPAAILRYIPELYPDFSKCERMEIYDTEETIFR